MACVGRCWGCGHDTESKFHHQVANNGHQQFQQCFGTNTYHNYTLVHWHVDARITLCSYKQCIAKSCCENEFALTLDNESLQVSNHVGHGWTLPRILKPHAFNQVDWLRAPVFAQPGQRWALLFLAHRIIDVVFIVALPWVLLSKCQSGTGLGPKTTLLTFSPAQPDSISQKTNAAENTSTL